MVRSWFSNPNLLKNQKNERVKVFIVRSRLNHKDVIINFVIN